MPSQSGLQNLGASFSGPIPIGVAKSGPISVGRTGGITRPPHERAQTIGRMSMDPSPLPPPESEGGSRRWGVILAAMVGLAVLGAGVFYVRGDGGKGNGAAAAASAGGDAADDGDDDIVITDRNDERFAEIDRLILAGKSAEADKLLGPMLDESPDDPGLVWRHGQLLAKSRKTKDRALAAYGQALDLDPSLLEDKDFYAQLHDLLRNRRSRDEALDIALRRMGTQGHSFLLELVNDDKPLGFNDRHRALDELAKDDANDALINWKLNRALDLLQATQSLTPCEHYAEALEVIADEPDPWYLSRVERAPVPEPKAGEDLTDEEKADAAKCEGLEDRRAAVIAMLASLQPGAEVGETDGGDEEPAAKPKPKPKKSSRRRKKKRRR
jgi:hypothetical protein